MPEHTHTYTSELQLLRLERFLYAICISFKFCSHGTIVPSIFISFHFTLKCTGSKLTKSHIKNNLTFHIAEEKYTSFSTLVHVLFSIHLSLSNWKIIKWYSISCLTFPPQTPKMEACEYIQAPPNGAYHLSKDIETTKYFWNFIYK